MEENQTNPSNWKWGIIYYNKNDKRIFVPKRSPRLGWTINAANSYAVLIMLGIFGAILALVLSSN